MRYGHPRSWSYEQIRKFLDEMEAKGYAPSVMYQFLSCTGVIMKVYNPQLYQQTRKDQQEYKREAREKKLAEVDEFVKKISYEQLMELIRRTYKAFINKARDDEEFLELKVIFLTKTQTGMRTGKRRTRKELWGTKVWITRNEESGKRDVSYISVDFTAYRLYWSVFCKWDVHKAIADEDFTDELKQTIFELVRRFRKDGDWLIKKVTSQRASKLLKQSAREVGFTYLANHRKPLHFLRSIFITNLVYSKIPIEVAVNFCVGWKDLNTAMNYYTLILQDFKTLHWDKIQDFKRRVSL